MTIADDLKATQTAYTTLGTRLTKLAADVAALAPPPDTVAPSVPTGLAGVAVSPTQVNLTWNPSTDAVGVKGYLVYDADTGSTIATVTVPAFSHTGLTPGTVHKYRVSAFDAVPNHSAWTDPPLAITTPTIAPVPSPTAGKFIQTFLVYYGGGPALTAADLPTLSKFDLIDINKYRYAEISPNTWAAIKLLNPAVQIYLYEIAAEASNSQDAMPASGVYGLGRYDVSRGHSMGSLNGNNPSLFLLDSAGARIYSTGFSNVAENRFFYLMDFGSAAWKAYWLEAIKTDFVGQPWQADGVHADNCVTNWSAAGYSNPPAKYATDSAWSAAMSGFVAAASAGLHAVGQKLWCNRGSSDTPAGAAAWLTLDTGPNPPDVVAEEGAFAVMWGTTATRFLPEPAWKSQLDTLAAIVNSKVAIFSHTNLAPGGSGVDNWNKTVTFMQSLWYALGSFLLGKNDKLNNSYFAFTSGTNYNNAQWYAEYEKINLGRALGPYSFSAVGGVNIYRREFELGFVYVNPTATDVSSITLPITLRPLTHDNLSSPVSSIPAVTSILLAGHNAAILLKG